MWLISLHMHLWQRLHVVNLQVKDAAASVDPWLQAPDLQENLGHLALAEGRMEDALQVGSRLCHNLWLCRLLFHDVV